jgi:predicted RNA-binding protein YlxR (DUF448 family)
MKPNYRRCISCRQVNLKQEFWRIVRVFPSGKVQLDQGMGRSAYICPQETCLQVAQKKNSLGKGTWFVLCMRVFLLEYNN